MGRGIGRKRTGSCRGADLKRRAGNRERHPQHLCQPCADSFEHGHHQRHISWQVLDKQQELITAVTPGRNSRVAERAQPRADQSQQFIPGGMPKRVVDPLEPVDVDEQQRRAGGCRVTAGERGLDPVRHRNPVGQPSQVITVRELPQLGLSTRSERLFPFNHRGDDRDLTKITQVC